jgi:hypothetical protein
VTPEAAVTPVGDPSSTVAQADWRSGGTRPYRRRVRRHLLVLLLAALSALVASTALVAAPVAASQPTVARTAVVVSPDPARDLYVGTGGLVVPSSRWRGDPGARSDTAACLDCQWRVSVLCTKAEAAAGNCRGQSLGCPVGTVPVRIWLLRPGQNWADVARACQGDTPPATVTDLGFTVRDRAEALLPPLRAGVQPATGSLVRIPTIFRSGQPAQGIQGADLSVLGLDVRLTSRVRWHWVYGDGTDVWTSSPGGVWPTATVSHVYLAAGRLVASVEAVWRAEFTVEGLGPFAVPGAPLTQRGSLTVVVRAAHAHLVG